MKVLSGIGPYLCGLLCECGRRGHVQWWGRVHYSRAWRGVSVGSVSIVVTVVWVISPLWVVVLGILLVVFLLVVVVVLVLVLVVIIGLVAERRERKRADQKKYLQHVNKLKATEN